MGYYRDLTPNQSLRFMDIIPTFEKFQDYLEKLNWDLKEPELFYDFLYMKYAMSTTRYMDSVPFILALRRQTYDFWDNSLKQREDLNRLRELEIKDIMILQDTIMNEVKNPNVPTVDASTTPIPNTASFQSTEHIKGNELDAINRKYSALFKNSIMSGFYRLIDPLFAVFLESDTNYVYDNRR